MRGLVSFNYLKTKGRGLMITECNARPHAGLFLLTPQQLSDASINRNPNAPVVAKPGAREQIGIAIRRDIFRDPKDISSDLHL